MTCDIIVRDDENRHVSTSYKGQESTKQDPCGFFFLADANNCGDARTGSTGGHVVGRQLAVIIECDLDTLHPLI
ncbi:hypothetical protein AOQ72_02815 [Bradyrhizobium yuanmingense]|uniref:Uncharacterized protein n=1 Tax=Bradyrhizobium yuanmingense TaxID=108015 RepID=A0A0R3BX50_9BRAD|nr:hypothetical protein AOQ72_02815 [Bradyrhizobium yuanmingense]